MDRDLLDLQFLGLYGIYKESCKLIFFFKKLFSQITLSLIIPLTFIYLAQTQISDLFFGTTPNHSFFNEVFFTRLPLSTKRTSLWLFRAGYLVIFLILSLLSTSAVVYTVACIYSAKPMTFKKIMGVVPQVWKRLLITFFWNFIILICYHFALALFLGLWVISFEKSTIFSLVVLIVMIILYVMGLVYINVIWQLACVVSVLEEVCGFKAMTKSRALVRGKWFAAGFIFVVMQVLFFGIEVLFEVFVVEGHYLAMVYRVMIGIGCFVMAVVGMLYGLVTQSVIYFVCKSYHHEIIDKSGLADHLEGYVGEYVRLNGRRDVQLGQVNV